MTFDAVRLFLGTLAIPPLLWALGHSVRWTRTHSASLHFGIACLGAYLARLEVRSVLSILREPREWDFLCFWIWGKLGASRADFYDPAAAALVANGYGVSDSFRRMILDVGFWYPPPTMLLFAPVGLMQVTHAILAWYAAIALLLGLSAVLLRRALESSASSSALIVLATLLLVLPTTRMTLWLAQTNFALLAMSVWLWLDRDRPRAGVWLALGVLIKPYFAVLALFLAVRKNARGLSLAAGAWFVICAIAMIAFGWQPFAAYLHQNPVVRLPIEVHSEPINQSLYATVLRLTHGQLDPRSVGNNVLFLVVAAFVATITAALAWRSRASAPDYCFSLILTAALMLYPSTLAHYALLLIVPLLLLWKRHRDDGGSTEAIILVFIAAVQLVTGFAHGVYAFWGMALVWLVFVVLSQFATRSAAERGFANTLPETESAAVN